MSLDRLSAYAIVVAVAAVAWAPGAASAGAREQVLAEADYEYRGVGAIDGVVDGTLAAYEVRTRSAIPDRFLLEDVVASFMLVRTEINYTAVAGQHAFEEGLMAVQVIRETPITTTSLAIDWPETSDDSLGIAYGPGWLERRIEPMNVPLQADELHWSTVAGHADREDYWFSSGGNEQYRYGGFSAWHRVMEAPNVTAMSMEGPLVLHLREAQLVPAAGERVQMDRHVRVESQVETPGGIVERGKLVILDGFLVVEEAKLVMEGTGFQVAASQLDVVVSGDRTMHDATGTYRVGSTTGRFVHESVVFAGVFQINESVGGAQASYALPAISGKAAGEITVVAVDLMVAASAAAGPSLLEQAAWLTLFLGLLGFLAWLLQHAWVFLYTRIKEDAVLEHPRRAQIMGFVEANPGCHVLRVAEDLGLARGVARHHLMVLERAGRLERFHESGQTLLVPAGQDKSVVLRAWAEEDPHLGTIRRVVAAGSVRRAELVATLRRRHGVADPTARRWIEKAVRAGLIEENGKGHSVTYRAAA